MLHARFAITYYYIHDNINKIGYILTSTVQL